MFPSINGTGTTIPELTNSEVKDILQSLDGLLNEAVLTGSLHDLALLECLGTVLARCVHSDHLYYFGAQWVRDTIVSRGIILYDNVFGNAPDPSDLYTLNSVDWAVLYTSVILATLLWCTIFIIYRILKVSGIAEGLRTYRRVIEVIVDSATLPSALIVVLLVFEVRNNAPVGEYLDLVASEMRGIIPTILFGRIAAGHPSPDDSWREGSTVSSLRFGDHSIDPGRTQTDAESNSSFRLRLDLEESVESDGRRSGDEIIGVP
ncbi:uncharacterized protein BT62DRAFT_1013613 [Guyanagaster necrorhizus]|uniref:Uncharacterized protein n=1 Tax=Guyanagaster necrorhizus TaxID=856835 RepID=A0A9P7VFJ7_9AGAR|nr:uncharacterized protein BT62DRAFT_1013613 [Guyanagaster necrorhizus MCA 3950]KAG7439652.1 hypothetical protein BT62DRAFT_1013613 [Guyanagaster necrorhizus MCA 3950]